MDYIDEDTRDPTGQCRVPTSQQAIFIYNHYPTQSQPDAMIMKLYELYEFAARMEKAKKKWKKLVQEASP